MTLRGSAVRGAFSRALEADAEAGVLAAPPAGRVGVRGAAPPLVIHEYFFFLLPRNWAVVLLTLSAEASCFAAAIFFASFLVTVLSGSGAEDPGVAAPEPAREPDCAAASSA